MDTPVGTNVSTDIPSAYIGAIMKESPKGHDKKFDPASDLPVDRDPKQKRTEKSLLLPPTLYPWYRALVRLKWS